MDDLDDLLDDQPLVIDEDELLSAGPVASVSDDELNLSILHIWSLLHGTVCISNGINPIMDDVTSTSTPIMIDKLARDISQGRLPSYRTC